MSVRIRGRATGGGGGGGGGGSATRSVGTEGESVAYAGALGAQSLGTEAEVMAILGRAATLPAGTGGASLALFSQQGAGAASVGSGGASLAVAQTGSATGDTGTAGASMSASSASTVTGYTGAATNTRNAGTIDWATPTNAQGNFDAANASITAAATTTAAASYNATLKCKTFGLGQLPSGSTRTKLEILIRHLWDLTVGALSTASIKVELRKADGTVLATPINRAQGSGDQATLLTETFDVTSAIAGLTETDIQALEVWCTAVCNLLITTGGNASWQVDGVHLRETFTRSGIT